MRPAPAESRRAPPPKGEKKAGAHRAAGFGRCAAQGRNDRRYWAFGRPSSFMPGLMPFAANQPLLISSA
ncbi:hypothetical protein VL15_38620 [Burkholderia cepacia]|uniref:Uncharacterized protein n=1 Tax=Burkholderia cepacia TaxID=292 RepID=A0A0J5VPQ7_BURCE|nr:hypothetical protein VL15_38620 [Burkholderia cepacia]